jgi:hypothetical protein
VAMASHFIEPCLPSPADHPPTGPDWVHEIKRDGYRLMARRDALSVGIRFELTCKASDGPGWKRPHLKPPPLSSWAIGLKEQMFGALQQTLGRRQSY